VLICSPAAAAASAAAVCLHKFCCELALFANWHCFFGFVRGESINRESMVFTRRQKQALIANNPLRDAGILRNVFAFLPGHWLFLGAVCREWEAVYASMADQQIQMCSFNLDNLNRCVTCGSKTTLCSAAVATPATARLAHSSRLAVRENEQLQIIAGLHADIETLTALRELGMLLSQTLAEAVAFSGRLHILQHLLSAPCCPNPDSLSHYAARCGSISMLMWLRSEGWCRYDAYTCEGAAEGGQLAALKHLRSAGCDWYAHSTAHSAAVSGNIELIEWLRPQQGIKITALTLAWAADFGQTAMCEHLLSNGMLMPVVMLLTAAALRLCAGCEAVVAHG
jgi:hypothetical protein